MSKTPPTVEQFRTRYSVFSSLTCYPNDTVQMYLDEAVLEISPCAFGGYYDKMVLLHTAHFLTIESSANGQAHLSGGQGLNAAFTAVGGINSASVGDVSVSLNLPVPQDGTYGTYHSTMFGQQMIRLIKKLGKGGLISKTSPSGTGCAPETQSGLV